MIGRTTTPPTPDRKMQRLQDCFSRLQEVDLKAQNASFDLLAHVITPCQFRDIVEPINAERELTLNEILELDREGYHSGPIVVIEGKDSDGEDIQKTIGRIFYKDRDI